MSDPSISRGPVARSLTYFPLFVSLSKEEGVGGDGGGNEEGIKYKKSGMTFGQIKWGKCFEEKRDKTVM